MTIVKGVWMNVKILGAQGVPLAPGRYPILSPGLRTL
jgi:hypothetical protein